MWEKIFLAEEGKEFIWSDRWWFDNGEVWFCAGDRNILFCIKKDSNEAIYISRIPSKKIHEFRNNPRCMKKDNIVFCFPDEGTSILCYDLATSTWKDIAIDNPDQIRLSCFDIWLVQSELYIVSVGLKKVIEFDIERLEIVGYHTLQTEEITGSILVDKYIYIIDSFMTSIYKFDCEKKLAKKYTLSGLDDHIKTICYDGQKFWLSGQRKRVYIWKEDMNKVSVVDDFPTEFGIYNFCGKRQKLLDCQGERFDVPLFLYSVVTDWYVWFIPFQTNEILYIDKTTCKINNFFLENENQTADNLKTQLLGHKYLLLYVKDCRYIGLFSLKNKWVFEIDAEKLTYKVLRFKLNANSVRQILLEIGKKEIFVSEGKSLSLGYLVRYLEIIGKNNVLLTEEKAIGKRIFSFLV